MASEEDQICGTYTGSTETAKKGESGILGLADEREVLVAELTDLSKETVTVVIAAGPVGYISALLSAVAALPGPGRLLGSL